MLRRNAPQTTGILTVFGGFRQLPWPQNFHGTRSGVRVCWLCGI